MRPISEGPKFVFPVLTRTACFLDECNDCKKHEECYEGKCKCKKPYEKNKDGHCVSRISKLCIVIGSLRNEDGDARDDGHFPFEFAIM